MNCNARKDRASITRLMGMPILFLFAVTILIVSVVATPPDLVARWGLAFLVVGSTLPILLQLRRYNQVGEKIGRKKFARCVAFPKPRRALL